MKTIRIPLLLLAFAVFFASCGNNKNNVDESMTPEQVIEVLSVKILKHEKDHELYFQRARMLMQVGKVNDAISDLVVATQLKNDNPDYYLLLADAYFANGDVEHSYSTLGKVLELDANNQEAILKQGEIAYYSRDYDRAMENLSKVTAKEPNNKTALSLKSFIYKEKGDTANAIVLLRKVCDLYPDYGLAFEELGVLYSMHQSPLAVEYLTTAIRLDPQNINAIYALAMFYQETGQMDAAEETYKQLLDVDPNNMYAWHNRGYIELFHYADYPLAIEYMTRALQCDSLFIEARVNRGCAYELSGDKISAERDFRIALQQRPTFQPAIDGMARLGKK
ncbi:MAG: tetratricopeptide repeat protein [Bacteroidales bacterium]|nr:tetratricopeptide repeat protein [Bacteroidales bacterium]